MILIFHKQQTISIWPQLREISMRSLLRRPAFPLWFVALAAACAHAPSPHSVVAAAPQSNSEPSTPPSVLPASSASVVPVPPVREPEGWFTLVSVPGQSLFLAPFADGAFVASQSLLAIIRGAQIRQDPEWLDGLPEYINWGGSLTLDLAPNAAPKLGLPQGTQGEAHVGNRHGPSTMLMWNGRKWDKSVTRPRVDPRLSTLRTSPSDEQIELRFATGELFVMRLASGKLAVYRFDPRSTSASNMPLPAVETESLYRASLVGKSPAELWFCSREGTILQYRDARWSQVAAPRQGSFASNCAVTADGSLFWVHFDTKGSLFKRDPDGHWTEARIPEHHSADAVYASGDRLWVTAAHEDENVALLLSNVAVTDPIELGEEQFPVDTNQTGLPGLDTDVIDVPSVSAIPAGPGTKACSSLVLWLGLTASPGLLAALRRIPEARDVELLQVMGMAPGKVIYPVQNQPFMDIRPSRKSRSAVALVPPSFDQGRAIERALVAALPNAEKPRLLCAVPHISKRLGQASH